MVGLVLEPISKGTDLLYGVDQSQEAILVHRTVVELYEYLHREKSIVFVLYEVQCLIVNELRFAGLVELLHEQVVFVSEQRRHQFVHVHELYFHLIFPFQNHFHRLVHEQHLAMCSEMPVHYQKALVFVRLRHVLVHLLQLSHFYDVSHPLQEYIVAFVVVHDALEYFCEKQVDLVVFGLEHVLDLHEHAVELEKFLPELLSQFVESAWVDGGLLAELLPQRDGCRPYQLDLRVEQVVQVVHTDEVLTV